MPDYVVQEEDGTSRITLEEGDGSVLLEESPPETNVRVTQVAVESLVRLNPNALVTQSSVEVMIRLNPPAMVSQVLVEVLIPVFDEFVPQIYRVKRP